MAEEKKQEQKKMGIGAWVAIALVGIIVAWNLARNEESKPINYLGDCRGYVNLYSPDHWAEEYGKSKAWVKNNVKINLWERGGEVRGPAVGKVEVGTQGLLLIGEDKDNVKVREEKTKVEGWIGRVQVYDIVYKDKAGKACKQQ